MHYHTIFRTNWIIYMGMKYNCSDFVITRWQEDDLPRFGCIKDILIVKDNAFFHVLEHNTIGIDRHYHSFCITLIDQEAVISLSDLIECHSFRGHHLLNGGLYITSRTYIYN